LAAALVHRPEILLLDEPTTGVDPVTRQDFWQLIIRLAGQNEGNGQATAVLVSTPYMDEASRCTRVGFMNHGRLIVEGSPGKLRASLEGRILELAGQPLTRIRGLVQNDPVTEDVQMFGDRLHLRVPPGTAEEVIERLQAGLVEQGCQVERIRVVPAQLEDVFMELLEAER
jgi:ABC-2 type transport system ATP-binding protein